MPTHDYRCDACGRTFEAVVRWDEYMIPCPVCHSDVPRAERIYQAVSMVDDTLPGGARYLHNLGDTPVWVETKTQYQAELKARGLVQAERKAYNRDDKSPYASRTRLRPGAHDPFLTAR